MSDITALSLGEFSVCHDSNEGVRLPHVNRPTIKFHNNFIIKNKYNNSLYGYDHNYKGYPNIILGVHTLKKYKN